MKKENKMNETMVNVVELRLHHEDPGNCLATFCGIGRDKGKWYNKSMSGAWFYTYPAHGYYENSHLVREPTVFRIFGKDDNIPYAIESNMMGAKFHNPYIFRDDVLNAIQEKYLKKKTSIDYDKWVKEMTNCKEYEKYRGYKDNFLYCESERLESIKVDTFRWAGGIHDILCIKSRHKLSGLEYWEYVAIIRPASGYDYEVSLLVYSLKPPKQTLNK